MLKKKSAEESQSQIKQLQLAEGIEKKRKKVEDRIAMIEQDRLLREISSQDDKKFVEICNAEIRRYQAEGKPVHTLLRALDLREPELLPAILVKVDKSKKEE
jgi:hypothetical protein